MLFMPQFMPQPFIDMKAEEKKGEEVAQPADDDVDPVCEFRFATWISDEVYNFYFCSYSIHVRRFAMSRECCRHF